MYVGIHVYGVLQFSMIITTEIYFNFCYRESAFIDEPDACCSKPVKMSPREQQSEWYGGNGSIKTLINNFQVKAESVHLHILFHTAI